LGSSSELRNSANHVTLKLELYNKIKKEACYASKRKKMLEKDTVGFLRSKTSV